MLPTARLPENLPTPTNSIVPFMVLCLFVFGLMAFASDDANQHGSRPERIRTPTLSTPGPRIRCALIEFPENDS